MTPFERMTAEEHDAAAIRCAELVAKMEGAAVAAILYRLESSAIEHRRAATDIRLRANAKGGS